MEKKERMKITLLGVFLIVFGIGILIFNFVFSQLASLGIIPITALMMIVIGFVFIRRSLAKY